jgi:micrococcal nuclease
MEKTWRGFHTILDLETSGLEDRVFPHSFNKSYVQDFFDSTKQGFEESAYYVSKLDSDSGRPYQLLGLHARGLLRGPSLASNRPIYVKPDQANFAFNSYARATGAVDRAQQLGIAGKTEEDLGHSFYLGLKRRIATHGSVEVAGWNGVSHLSMFESLTHRYRSLNRYQGFFAQAAEAGQFSFRGMEDDLLRSVWAYGQAKPDWAKANFLRPGRLAHQPWAPQGWEELRQVKFWSLENVVQSLGGWKQFSPQVGINPSVVDHVAAQKRIGSIFSQVQEKVAAGHATALFENWGTEISGSSFFDNLFSDIRLANESIREERAAGARLLSNARRVVTKPGGMPRDIRYPLIGLGIAAAAAISYGLAFGKRKDRQTQIEGLRHLGIAGRDRKKNTDFGSGWQGLDEDSQNHRQYVTWFAAGGLYAGHRWATGHLPEYSSTLYNWAKVLEDRSPRRVLRTLGASQRLSQYLPTDLRAGRGELFSFVGLGLNGVDQSGRTRLGHHLGRLTPDIDWNAKFLANPKSEVSFLREGSSPFQRMFLNGNKTKYRVSFVESRGALALNSEQFGANLFESVHNSKQLGLKAMVEGKARYFSPYRAIADGQPVGNLWNGAQRETFGYANRLNQMLHEFHIPLARNSYNGTASMVSRMLTHRVLPAAGLLAGAGYLDYLLGHKPSNLAYDLYAKGRVGWAEATDTVPGARGVTDWYKEHVPGPQYGPLALPAAGALAAGIAHYSRVVSGQKFVDMAARTAQFRRYAKVGAVAGAVLALPFLPGMLGSRKTADQVRSEFSGETPVAVRSGRWWQFGVSPLEGNRISMYRPHQYVLHKTRAEDISVYGSEDEKWGHNPFLHPLRWFKDPNWLAKKHAADRPYPMTSPAFSNVPLIGPLLAATVGKVVAPPVRMHEGEWDGRDYTLYTKAVEPKSPRALAPEHPDEEFSLAHVAEQGEHTAAEAIGLPGFLMKSAKKSLFGRGDGKPEVYFEGSREMTSLGRSYRNLELGGLPGPHPEAGITSYSEPIRRFLIGEEKTPRANELQNQMPSWLPNGDEYFFDFHKGDVYSRLPYGSIRLPGAGYEALHPEVAGLDAEEYPDIEKLRILGDVAPWSRSFKRVAAKLGAETRENEDTIKRIDYERITDRARRMRESTVRFEDRHTGPTDEITGTVRVANDKEIQLEEYAGRYFSWSGVDGRAAALAAHATGVSNADLVSAVKEKKAGRSAYFADKLAPGTQVRLVVPRGGADVTHASAVVFAGSTNVNRELIDRGFGEFDPERAGSEMQAMDGAGGRLMRKYAESMAFQGDQAWYNPLRLVPASVHAKIWNQRTALETYINQEVSGTRMRRWQRPLHDFVKPYLGGSAHRLTGRVVVDPETQEKRDLDTLADQLEYLRSLYSMSSDPEKRGQHFLGTQRTSIGANLFGETDRLPQTLPTRERKFFQSFLGESDPDKRSRILATVSKEMADTLVAQWTKQANKIRQATGRSVEEFSFSGRYVSQEDIDRATDLNGKVVKVIDGDSLRVRTNEGEREVRLANINTPEMISYSGRIAKQMTEKLALGEHVRLHTVGEDKYGRTVADVFTDDKRLLNYELLNSGHAQKDVYQNSDGSKQSLSIGDFFRAREIAQFFKRRGLALPDDKSEVMASDIDYEDVKVKIIQWEGLDFHDFNIYDDRVAMLWRKPYLDGAVRELTSGDDRSVEDMTIAIEQSIAQSKVNDRKAQVRTQRTHSRKEQSNIRIDVNVRPDKDLEKEIRRNADDYR